MNFRALRNVRGIWPAEGGTFGIPLLTWENARQELTDVRDDFVVRARHAVGAIP